MTPDDVRLAFLGYGMDIELVAWIADSWFTYWVKQGKSPEQMYRIALACEFPTTSEK